jgi:hypothetical protein
MPIVAKQSEGREPIAAGAYHSVCTQIVDLGTQPPGDPKYRPRQMVLLTWELCDERVEFEKDGVKQSFLRTISRRFPLSLGGGNKPTELRKVLESWRSRPFTADELAGFELKHVLGANGILTVVHNATPTATYANVGSVSPLMKGTPKRAPDSHPLYFTLSDIPEGAPLVWPPTMPEWIRTTIMKSAEYITRFEGGAHEDDRGFDGDPGPQDDDIPF